jgi:hypothetical protein
VAVIEGTSGLKEAAAEYDFAVDGGAIGTITLRGTGSAGNGIPSGAVVLGGYVNVLTGFTTGSAATMALQIEGAGDLVAATVVSGAPYSSTGRKSVIPAFTGATTVATTAARALTAVIATGTVTAGKLQVVVFWR